MIIKREYYEKKKKVRTCYVNTEYPQKEFKTKNEAKAEITEKIEEYPEDIT